METQITSFLEHLAQTRSMSAHTVSAYRTDLDQLAMFMRERGVAAWDAVSRDDLLAFLLYLRERRYANATVARRTAATKTFFGYLMQQGIISTDVADQVESPRVDRTVPRSLTPHEVDDLLELPLRNPTPERRRDKAMLELLYATGMRVSELVALDTEHLSMEEQRVTCANGGKSRTLSLTPSAYTAIEEYLDNARSTLGRGTGSSAALFLNHRGKRLTRQGFWLILKGYAEELGMAELTPHTLRHSFAAHMLKEGVDVKRVQEMLGHASVATTQIYVQGNGQATD